MTDEPEKRGESETMTPRQKTFDEIERVIVFAMGVIGVLSVIVTGAQYAATRVSYTVLFVICLFLSAIFMLFVTAFATYMILYYNKRNKQPVSDSNDTTEQESTEGVKE